jgi:EPS-associated MarR family transcriptional regulator
MNKPYDQEIRYRLLKILSRDADLTQREMAGRMGVSLGKVNFCLSELGKRGFIKIRRFKVSRNKSQYIYLLTPRGLEEKTRLTVSFLRRKIVEYEEIKRQIRDLVLEVEEQTGKNGFSDDAQNLLRRMPREGDAISYSQLTE